MLSTVVIVLVLLGAAGRVLSCSPCSCYVDDGTGHWPHLQVASCVKVGLIAVPSTDTLPDHTQVIRIWDASIPVIKVNQFIAFQKLLFIRIQNSQISKVERRALRNMTQLIEFDLASNLITELPVGLFLDTPRLVKLYLYGNKLKVLPKNLISNLNYLKLVGLADNQIVSVEANCFKNVPKLEALHVHNNKLTTLKKNFIDDWSSLKELNLSGNPWHCNESLCGVMAAVVSRELWTTVSRPTCATPQSLQGKQWNELEDHAVLQQCTCSPCRCEIPSVVRCHTPLSTARLPDTLPSNITHLLVTNQQFTTLNNSAFSSYALLQELHLEQNQIHNIEPNAFLNLNILSVLNLAHNELQDLGKNIFSPMLNIMKISLNDNNLTRLNQFQFSNFVMLKEVDISFNNIRFIEEECFVNVSSLRTINLSNNQLETLQLNVIDFAMGLERLHLEGNPWRCDEALCVVLDAVVGRALWGPGTVLPACAAPPTLAGIPWPQLPQHFHPDIYILDSNKNWTRAGRATSVLAARDVTLQCRYCFVSRVAWALNGVKLPRSWQRTLQKALISTLTMENIHKEEQGDYVCQVSHCPECDTAWLHITVNTTIPETVSLNEVFHIADNSTAGNTKRGLILLQYTIREINNTTELSQGVNDSVITQTQVQVQDSKSDTQTLPSWLPIP